MISKQPDWLFHWVAPIYDFLIRRPQTDRLKQLLDLPATGRLLDLGGGTGRVSSQLTVHTAHVVVCDTNGSMLLQTRKKKKLIPVQADAKNLPFSVETFDAILVVDALHHFSNQDHVLSEMLRVLKPGGRLLIEEQDIRRFPIQLVQGAERLLRLHSRFLTPGEISNLIPSGRHQLYVEKGSGLAFRVLIRKNGWR